VAIIKAGKLIINGKMDEIKGNSSLESVFLELEDSESSFGKDWGDNV
jgi:ABC-2 type transport system ATP-binding protein